MHAGGRVVALKRALVDGNRLVGEDHAD
jgi:hypothetical protein